MKLPKLYWNVGAVDESFIKCQWIVKTKTKAWKTGFYKEKLQPIKNLSTLSLNHFFFIKTFVKEVK